MTFQYLAMDQAPYNRQQSCDSLEDQAKLDALMQREQMHTVDVTRDLSQSQHRRAQACVISLQSAVLSKPLCACRCVLQRDGPDSQKLPTSHTCFNTLLLPSYRSKEVMANRLKLAIMNSEGFGLE